VAEEDAQEQCDLKSCLCWAALHRLRVPLGSFGRSRRLLGTASCRGCLLQKTARLAVAKGIPEGISLQRVCFFYVVFHLVFSALR
jgi:hypothetical protein